MDDVELGRAIGRGDWADPAEPVEVEGVVAAVGRRRRRRRWAAVAGTGAASAAAASVVLLSPAVPSADDPAPTGPVESWPPVEELVGKDVGMALGLESRPTSDEAPCSGHFAEYEDPPGEGNAMGFCLEGVTDDPVEEIVLAFQITGRPRTDAVIEFAEFYVEQRNGVDGMTESDELMRQHELWVRMNAPDIVDDSGFAEPPPDQRSHRRSRS